MKHIMATITSIDRTGKTYKQNRKYLRIRRRMHRWLSKMKHTVDRISLNKLVAHKIKT